MSFIRARRSTMRRILQELMALTSLLFVDKKWPKIIDEGNGQEQIEGANIDPEELRTFYLCSVRGRFSRASRRNNLDRREGIFSFAVRC